jgi:phosphoenolpyruvate carboxylase
VRTVTVQSAFRYDHPVKTVKNAVARLEAELPKTPVPKLDLAKQERLVAIAEQSAKLYRQTINGIVGDMQPVFKAVPKRRDRRQHIGLLAYSRSMGEQTLPRAITFTAAFYSIGVPPEFIGFGRTLKQLSDADRKLLFKQYPNLKSDLQAVGGYLNKDNLAALAKLNKAWQAVQTDVADAEDVLGTMFGPHTKTEREHRQLTAHVLLAKSQPKVLQSFINETAVLRKSLG